MSESRQTAGTLDPNAIVCVSLVVTAILLLWVPPLTTSLRLDETATAWVTGNGFGTAIRRSAQFQGESPLYFIVIWLLRHVIGSSEVALRLPSFAAMIGSTILLWKLARLLFGTQTAWMTALAFTGLWTTLFTAGDARPYGLALCAAIGSSYVLVLHVRNPSAKYLVGYGILVVAVLYLQFIVAIVLLSQVPLILWNRRMFAQRHAYLAGSAIILAALPLVPQLASLYARRDLLSVPVSTPTWRFFSGILPGSVIVPIFVSLGCAITTRNLVVQHPFSPGVILFVLSWLLLPYLFVYGLARVSDITLFDPRYLATSRPALALIAGTFVGAIRPFPFRMIASASFLIFAILAFGGNPHAGDDWRGALAAVQRADGNPAVLIQSGFIESRRTTLLTRRDWHDYLLSPLSAYPVGRRAIVLPYDLSSRNRTYLESVIEPAIASRAKLVAVTFEPLPDVKARMDELAHSLCYDETSLGKFGALIVTSYAPATCPATA